MLRGELHADQGEIDFPAQMAHGLRRAGDAGAGPRRARLRDRRRRRACAGCEAELAQPEAQPESADNGTRIGELHAALADADAYTVRSRGEQLLLGLGFTLEQMQQPVASFSGGWRMRLNLAQALMCPSDLLLLDEPTNHLDLDAIIWLEDWLKRYAGTLIIISHDRDFLDGVVNVDRAHRRAQAQALLGQLLGASSASAPRRWCWPQGMIEKQQRERAHLRVVHRPLQGQGHQGAPGAEPHEGAGEDGRAGAAARRAPSSRSSSASRCARPTRCW